MNILVSCAGGPAAVGVIKSLKDMNFDGKVVAIDCDELSVGFHLVDKSYVVPFSVEDIFWEEILKIIRKEEINLILPTGDADIVHFSKNKTMLNKMGVTVFMSSYESINICQDKFKFYDKCKNKFSLPKTNILYENINYPILCKPKRGSGSRGIRLCYDENCISSLETDSSLHRSGDYIYQEYLPGQEYTIDVLCDMQSNPISVVVRKRLQIKAGISSKGEIVKNNFIEKGCFDICKFLKLKGPICLQMKEDEKGIPKFIEINPRFGGSTYFTTLAGVNFMKIILDLIEEKEIKINKPKNIKVLRYYNEVVIDE
tara:strand:+ start:1737 stop:2678 length:942 start_codon:yes stop_codon:yes gene_type:complete